jgi:hypothetical protein
VVAGRHSGLFGERLSVDAYSIPEAASLAGVGPRELREAVESGQVPATRRDGRWFVGIKEIEDLRLRLVPPSRELRDASRPEELTSLERRLEELERRITSLEAHRTSEEGDERAMRSALTPLFRGPQS